MQSNKIIRACAGWGKTNYIVQQALLDVAQNKRVLIVTYTNSNLDEIRSIFQKEYGGIPPLVTLLPWFTFLLRHAVRPYQNMATSIPRIQSIYYFKQNQIDNDLRLQNRYATKATPGYYFLKNKYIYEHKVSDFAFECNRISGGLIINRLIRLFDTFYIDEAQDLEGWDYDFIGLLLNASNSVTIVGDPRQKILMTHRHRKNSGLSTIYDWIERKYKGEYELIDETESRRCHQTICDLANEIHPELPAIRSSSGLTSDHVGIVMVQKNDVTDYIKQYSPIVLRNDKRTNTLGLPALNIGQAKGKTFDHVLIFPTPQMKKYIQSKDLTQLSAVSRFYVAITRARFSVAFVI